MLQVRFAFMLAHRQLTNCDDDDFTIEAGLLARVVRVDEKLAARKCLAPPPPDRGKMSAPAASAGQGKKRPGSSSTTVQKRSKWKRSIHAEELVWQEKSGHKRSRSPEHQRTFRKQEHWKFFASRKIARVDNARQNHRG